MTTSYGIQSITYNPATKLGTPVQKDPSPTEQEMSFLQLLVAQVSNQTPDSPMDPTAMITQYSQMQAAIGLVKLNASSFTYQNSAIATALMNQTVTIQPSGTAGVDSRVNGTVSGIDFSGDTPLIQVNGEYYPVTDVVHVGA